MDKKRDDPVPSAKPTICAVCAWRLDCNKKFSFPQGGPVKCADFTRDVSLPAQDKERP